MTGVSVYVTAGNTDEAINIARTLIHERLAACANILGEITSVYRWEDAVHEDPETAIILKSRRDLVGPLTERIKELHSYDCPCVTALDITGGNPEFLAWIETETD